jgi:hypothetical protein
MENVLMGTKQVLFVDTVTPITTPYDEVTVENAIMVACLMSTGFAGTTSPIDTSSKCSPDNFAESLGGQQGWTVPINGMAIGLSVGDTRKNHNALMKLWRGRTVFWGFVMDMDATEDSVTMRYGLMRLDNWTETYPNQDKMTFDGTLTGIGYPGDQQDITPVV